MLDKNHFMNLNIIKKEAYTGSFRGMRYRLEKKGEKPEESILVYIWPEPYCFDKTPEEQKKSRSFPFCEEGKDMAVDWLNEEFVKQYERK